MRFEIKLWWTNGQELYDADIDESSAKFSSKHFLRLLEEKAFGDKVDVQFEVYDCHVVATVRVDDEKDASSFMQRLFGHLSVWVIDADHVIDV